MNTSRILAASALVLALATGCGSAPDEDCDAEDLRNREAECGYYDANSVFIAYPWVAAGKGGKPPKGAHPTPPAGVRVNPPPKPAQPAVKAPARPAKPARPASKGGRR